MRFNPEADNVKGGGNPLRPMAPWALWEVASEGSLEAWQGHPRGWQCWKGPSGTGTGGLSGKEMRLAKHLVQLPVPQCVKWPDSGTNRGRAWEEGVHENTRGVLIPH